MYDTIDKVYYTVEQNVKRTIGEIFYPAGVTDAYPAGITDAYPAGITDAYPAGITDAYPAGRSNQAIGLKKLIRSIKE